VTGEVGIHESIAIFVKGPTLGSHLRLLDPKHSGLTLQLEENAKLIWSGAMRMLLEVDQNAVKRTMPTATERIGQTKRAERGVHMRRNKGPCDRPWSHDVFLL
jgi:hypothetical protein